MSHSLRWKERFTGFEKALDQLHPAVKRDDIQKDPLILAGLIQTFEFTMELGWKTMQDYLQDKGFDVHGSKDTMRVAFQEGFIARGHDWIDAIEKRNIIAHTYDVGRATDVVDSILKVYYPMLCELYEFFSPLYSHESSAL